MRKILLQVLLCLAAILSFVFTAKAVSGLRMYIVMSGSMEPVIRTGSLIILDTMKTKPEPGEIITYDMGGTLVTHRVLRNSDGMYVTKGDSNPSEDHAPVSGEQIRGTVILSVPMAGAVILMLRRPSAICLLVPMILLIIAIKHAKERNLHEKDHKSRLFHSFSHSGDSYDRRNNGLSD